MQLVYLLVAIIF